MADRAGPGGLGSLGAMDRRGSGPGHARGSVRRVTQRTATFPVREFDGAMSGRDAEEMARAVALPQLDASSLVDGERLEAEVRDMYGHVARGEEADLHFELGRDLAEHLGYSRALLDAIPAEALASFAGVGHHLDLAALRPGDEVLDLGSGSGTDVFCGAMLVGSRAA